MPPGTANDQAEGDPKLRKGRKSDRWKVEEVWETRVRTAFTLSLYPLNLIPTLGVLTLCNGISFIIESYITT